MKVLVTGATGFVGSWMARKLLEDGHEIHVLARPTSSMDLLAGLPVHVRHGDVTDAESVKAACSGMQSVFHLAGHVGYSRAERPLMDKINVEGTRHVVAACREARVQRLVYMSSVVAIGAAFRGQAPLTEESEYNVGHLNLGYFETKRAAEILVREAVRRGEIDAVILNPSTIYGPGDFTKGSRKAQLKVARGKLPFYPPGGVSVIAVEDVVAATHAAWTRGRSGERYILAGENLLIKDLFDLIAAEAGVRPPWIRLPEGLVKILGRFGEWRERRGRKGPFNMENAWTSVLYHWFDASKAHRELGLNPKSAKECIAASVGWARERGIL